MPNLRMGFRNAFDAAEGCLLSASPALATGFAETQLQKMERTETARTTSLASQAITAIWNQQKRFNYLFLRMHNFTVYATLACPTYSDQFLGSLIAANAAAVAFGYTGLARNDVLTDDDFRLLKNTARYLTLATNVMAMRLTLLDANNQDGFIDLSRIHGGEYYEYAYQIPGGGAPLQFDDLSTQDASDDGSTITDKGPKRRKLTLTSDFFTDTDWNELLAGARHAGKDRDIFVSLNPGAGNFLEVYNQGLFKFQEIPELDMKLSTQGSAKLVLVEA